MATIIEALKRTAEQLQRQIAELEQERNPTVGAVPEPTEAERYLRTLGEKIRDERIKAGFSRYELSKRSTVQHQQIKSLEQGKLNPGAYTLHLIARALDIDIKI